MSVNPLTPSEWLQLQASEGLFKEKKIEIQTQNKDM